MNTNKRGRVRNHQWVRCNRGSWMERAGRGYPFLFDLLTQGTCCSVGWVASFGPHPVPIPCGNFGRVGVLPVDRAWRSPQHEGAHQARSCVLGASAPRHRTVVEGAKDCCLYVLRANCLAGDCVRRRRRCLCVPHYTRDTCK